MKSKRWLLAGLRRWLARLGWMVGGAIAAAVALLLVAQARRPELEAWHLQAPASELRAAATDADLAAYRVREEQVFRETEEILAVGRERMAPWSRYRSPAVASLRAVFDGNRTFEIAVPERRGVAVLLHGLSDSPYSVRGVAEALAGAGFVAIALRLPGHGTVPAGLLEVTFEDWRAAVDLAVREAAGRTGGRVPLLLVGYSNGAALALDAALRALSTPGLPRPDGLVFLSPAFAVSEAAALAPWQHRLSRLPALGKLGWTDLEPEFDPFKYNSFTINAAAQIHHLTTAIEDQLVALEAAGRLAEIPPVLGLQSVVDATIPPLPSLTRLFGRLRGAGNELVLFDVNRTAGIETILRPEALALTALAERRTDLPFTVTLVANRSAASPEVEARTRRPGAAEAEVERLDLAWPSGLYSLSHVAVPFPPDDPVYGREAGAHPPYPLGRLDLRGESRALLLPTDLLIRLRYNPFFPYLATRVTRFAGRLAEDHRQ